jgi:hypothetical protein
MNTNIFVDLVNSTKEALNINDFDYPLQFTFNVYGYNASTKEYAFLYDRKINVQQDGLKTGLNIHLNKLVWQKQQYRLYLNAEDNRQRKFKCITCITLGHDGLIQTKNPRHLNTFLLEIDN